jgi:hypothetical protein
MHLDADARTVEQEVAAGQSETTPVVATTSVITVSAIVFVVALALAVIAYEFA